MTNKYQPISPTISKITSPKVSGVVERKRLFRALDAARKKPVVWITSPAGSGKTTLAASYLNERKLPHIWYQVDEGDGDLATFFYYMGLAAKKAAPRYKKPLPLLTPEYLLGIQAFTRRYFENLFGRLTAKTAPHLNPLPEGEEIKNKPLSFWERGRGEGRFTLVLDNYQDMPQDSQFHDMIANGFDVIPEGVNVIVISRSEPPPQIVRLLANNRRVFISDRASCAGIKTV